MTSVQIPIFPLYTVLFPGNPLPLRIFEARYLDMVSQCLKADSGFGVCLIREGSEVGPAANTVETGVLASIVDWHQRQDGLLGITVMGEQRFDVLSVKVQKNQLAIADVVMRKEPEGIALPEKYLVLVDVVKRLIEHAGQYYANLPVHFTDAGWVANRLSELLPIELHEKQQLLEMDDPLQRLEILFNRLEGMEVV